MALAGITSCSPAGGEQGLAPSATSVVAPLNRARSCNANSLPRKDHYGVYHPATATFTLENRRPGWSDVGPSQTLFVYGNPNLRPLIGDWDGDGTETVGIWVGGTFALKNSNGSGFADLTFGYGNANDIPIVGDWIGQGKTTVGVFRAGTWYLRYSNTTGFSETSFTFGNPDDVPVVGDWDGDGVDTIGVFRNGTWFLRNSNTTGPPDLTLNYGDPGTIPIVGDWDGDGVDTVGVYANGALFLKNANTCRTGDTTCGLADINVTIGGAGDVPLAGNWAVDGDGYGSAPAALASFFPLGVDLQPASSFPHWKTLGMNTAIRAVGDVDVWTAAANTAGLKMIRQPRPNNLAADANEPNLLAWSYVDEIDGGGSAQISAVQTAYTSYKAANPRPFLINFVGEYVLSPYDGHCNGPGDSTDPSDQGCYPGFIANEDWISEDIYPFKSFGGDLTALTRTIDKLRRWSGGKPQFAYVALTAIHGPSGFVQPTPDQVRANIWEAIVHGARGIFYFPHGNCDECTTNDGVPPDVAAEVQRQNATITNLAGVLQTTVNPTSFGVDATRPLDAGWRSDGAGSVYVIVVNTSASTVAATVAICGRRPTVPIAVYGENRTVAAAGAFSITDQFAPYAVHIYVIR